MSVSTFALLYRLPLLEKANYFMQPDAVLVEETRNWLVRAMRDLRAADVDLAVVPPLLDDAVFHCQQAVEKSYKAFLTFHNQPFRRTHNLEETGQSCLALDATLGAIVDEAVPLSEYAWAYRYPGPYQDPLLEEVTSARDVAGRALQAVLDRLPPNVRPV